MAQHSAAFYSSRWGEADSWGREEIGSHMELESIFGMYLWIDTKEINAGMHKFIFYRYLFSYLLSGWFIPKEAPKNEHQFKENSNLDLFLATANPGSQQNEAGGRSPLNRVYLTMPKGKVVQITKNPRDRFSRSLPKTRSLEMGMLKQGWATRKCWGSTSKLLMQRPSRADSFACSIL